MKEQLLLMIELQECDSQLANFADKKKKLPEKINKLEEEFQALQTELEQSRRKYDEVKSRHAECENRIKKINEGMIKTKERLLEVKNNKEYQAMLKENEAAEVTRGDVETEILSLLDDLEKLALLAKKDQTTIEEQKKKYEEQKRAIEAELNSLDTDFAGWEQKRNALQENIPADLLSRYERIKKSNNGVGVISVWKSVCNGCHMNIPPQLYNELQRTQEMLSCPNCHRIMYFKNIDKTE